MLEGLGASPGRGTGGHVEGTDGAVLNVSNLCPASRPISCVPTPSLRCGASRIGVTEPQHLESIQHCAARDMLGGSEQTAVTAPQAASSALLQGQ